MCFFRTVVFVPNWKERMRFSLLSLPLFLLAQPAVAGAEALSSIADNLKTFSDRAEYWIPFFQRRAEWILWMTIGVIILGAISTITSTISALVNRKSSKIAVAVITAAISASISIVTGFKSQVFHADQDSYRAIEIGMRQVVESIKQDLKNYQVALEQSGGEETISEADAQDIRDKFKTDRTELFKLDDRARKLEITILTTFESKSATFFKWPEITTAFASSQQSGQAGPTSYLAWGTGNCDTIYGAREYARYDGLRRLAIQVEPKASAERLDALINAIDGSVTEGRNILSKDSRGGRFVIQQTEMSLNKVFVQRSLLRVGSGVRPSPNFSAALTLRPGFSGQVEVGSKLTPKGLEGAFIFLFNVNSRGDVTRLQLIEFKVYNNSGTGSTRWSFDVMLGGQRVFAIPVRRLEDSGRPTTCKTVEGEKLEGAVDLPNSGTIEIKVIGYRPRDL